jgi:hypothetical protein
MAYRSVVAEDRILFFLSDTNIIELNSYDKVKMLVEASSGNLESLIADINENLIASAEEELVKMTDGTGSLLQKTSAYAKLLQVVGQYHYLEEKNRQEKLEQERLASGVTE